MKLAIKCTTYGESLDAVDFCVVDLDNELIKIIKKLGNHSRIIEKDLGAYPSIHFFNYHPEFYTYSDSLIYDPEDMDSEREFEIEEWENAESLDVSECDLPSVECVELIVDAQPDGKTRFYWHGVLKHTDIAFESVHIDLEDLEGK